MKKLFLKVYTLSKLFIRKISNQKNQEDIHHNRVVAWNKIEGDKTLRLNYPLDQHSIVVDVGGFEGQWASDIFGKYCCKVFVFEPVKKYADKIDIRFKNNKNIICYNVGLSNKDTQIEISILGDKSSLFKTSTCMEKINVVNTSEFLNKNKIDKIDLIKMNIEGAEYDLLENIIESGFIKDIKNIQIQFHDFAPNAKERMREIQKKLSITHYPTYQYEFVWENWERFNN